jgi:4-amino-4-deoxy-L-arabinose transferase-like glycosyltransferase
LKARSNGTTGTRQPAFAPVDSAPPYSLWKDPLAWALLAVALGVRVLYSLALHPGGHPPLDFVIDEREYFSAAHVFAEGRGFAFYNDFTWVRPPVYVLFLGGLFGMGGGNYEYVPVLLVQSVISAASLVPFGLLAWEVGGRAGARWTLGLGALYLPFSLFAGLLVSETLFLGFFGFALLAIWKGRQALVRGGSRTAYMWLAGAGLLLGCATLTRSTAIAFIFIAALWLLLSLPRDWPPGRKLVPFSLLVLVALATLAPWSVRNYSAYHRFIPVDTTGGYNLWLASLGVRDEPRMQAELRAVAGQGERQDYAFARAWETIAADPAAFAGKGLKESLDLWKPSLSAEENAVRGYPSGRVPAWHLALLVVLDSLLYIAILLLAVLGFALTKPTPLKWLTAGWVLLWVVMSFVFFAVTRFRMPVVASLLPWAGLGMAALPRGGDWRGTNLLTRVSSAAAVLAIVAVVGLNVPVEDTLKGIAAWQRQAPFREGERLLGEGRAREAAASYRQADLNVADTRYGLAAALLQQGSAEEAMSALRPAEPDDRYEPPILRGQAARLQGNLDTARSFFNARVVQVAGDEALRWAWDHLRPESVQSLELGSGLDVGYVRGFHGPEKDANGRAFRWSLDRAEVRGISGGLCTLDWNGWRPSGLPPAEVTLTPTDAQGGSMPGLVKMELSNSPEWSATRVPSSPASTISGLVFDVRPFVVSGSDPRLVGVQIAWVSGCQR